MLVKIPLSTPHVGQQEIDYVLEALKSCHLQGDGKFTEKCHEWLNHHHVGAHSLLTHSCTAALEMSAILSDVGPGDEVIMPSFTFVSTANPFILRRAKVVFIDIRPDTLNMDENLIEAAITPRTKAIVPVHYAGVGCEMNQIMSIARKHNLIVIEDAAQALMGTYHGKPLGTLGHMAALSFHDTKNIMSGEGGAILINDKKFLSRAEIIRQKGTNRKQFLRGEVDKYTWVDIGSSYLPSEILAALLLAQLAQAKQITQKRIQLWNKYYEALSILKQKGVAELPTVPSHCQHNGHIFYLLLKDEKTRNALMDFLKSQEITSAFHYIPLHSAPAGIRYGQVSGSMQQTDSLSSRLLRLPSYFDLDEQGKVIDKVLGFFK